MAIIFITGANKGLGHEAARRLIGLGHTVLLGARDAERGQQAAAALGARFVQIDVTDDDSVAAAASDVAAHEGRVDVLINNAGFAIFDPIENARPEELESMMQTNFFGTVWCTQAVLPQMLARGEGTIVNVASIAGIMGYARMGGYCATKFAMIGFTEALRDEVLGRGVRVAVVCPGTTETEFFAKAERGKMPGASRLILGVSAERVARVICRTAEDGKFRRILPPAAALYMRMKEIFPRFAHLLMRRVSALLER